VSAALVEVPVGYRTGGWEVMTRIASGSWASVYTARRVQAPRAPEDPPQDVLGALKFLPGGTLSPPQYADLRESVNEEIRFNEEVDHPRLIRTFETFVVDDPAEPNLHGSVVLAMERAATSLQDLLDTVTPPHPAPNAARVIAEICEALVHVHASGWVHGDLKPSNVLLMQDGSVRLADFGLARELEGTHAYAPRLGSSDFLPPEWWSERIGEQGIATRTTADIWALGVTAHQLLTGGMFPFLGASARARGAAAQTYADGQAELRLADELPPAWRSIVADCLAPDHAARRPHSAASLLARVEALVAGEAVSPPRPARRAAPWRSGRAPWRSARAPWRSGRAPWRSGRAPWRSDQARVAAVALAAVASITGGALALTGGAPAPRAAALKVFNAEVACQRSRLAQCRLGLAGDPRAMYAPANVVGHTRHGNRLVAECYIPDGRRVGAEDGRSSTRWYRVRTTSGTAWLPGVRAWPGAAPALARCAS
jgi:serine/threonine-protein kinase